ncbi:LOW QUALITY PROTEIN: adipose-secreted signaling protein [Phoenicopterus ruber ruber]
MATPLCWGRLRPRELAKPSSGAQERRPGGWPAASAFEVWRKDDRCGDTWLRLARAARRRGGGVRFAPSQPAEGAHGHVHFDEKLHDSAVMVTQEKDGFLVKVGFLKILHKYEITFLLPLVQAGKDICAVPLPNLNLRVIGITPLPEGYSVKCEYTAHKEGVLKEEMLLASEAGEGACLKVVVQARVMDRHHGTPMLLDGVRCVGAELEYDSEQSDWHGFD